MILAFKQDDDVHRTSSHPHISTVYKQQGTYQKVATFFLKETFDWEILATLNFVSILFMLPLIMKSQNKAEAEMCNNLGVCGPYVLQILVSLSWKGAVMGHTAAFTMLPEYYF